MLSSAAVACLIWLAIIALATIRYWMLRTWRTALSLLLGAAAIVAIDQLEVGPAAALQVGVAGVITAVMLIRSEPLWAMRVADRRFVDDYAAIRTEIRDLRSRIGTTPPTDYLRDFEVMIERLEGLQAPSEDWAALQAETAVDLRRRLAVMRGDAEDPSDPEDRWHAIERRYTDLIQAKTSFWLLWPWP